MARQAARHAAPGPYPSLLVLTDPHRTPDPLVLAHRLPTGSALIYRHYGTPQRFNIARTLRRITAHRGAALLVSADLDLARSCDADGIHWPERLYADAARARVRGCGLWFTGAAHSLSALHRAGAAGLDAALLSPVFPSKSPSATHPKGVVRTRLAIRQSTIPVYALGGLDETKIKRLADAGAGGFAVVGAMER